MKGYRYRPVPDDFAERTRTMSRNELCLHYRTGSKTLYRWMEATGHRIESRRVHPDDFPVMATRLDLNGLVEHYGVTRKRVQAWARKAGIKLDLNRDHLRLGPPHDFARVAPTMTKTELLAHYNRTWKVIVRWLAETGVQTAAYVKPRRPAPLAAHRSVPRLHYIQHGPHTRVQDMRQRTMYDDAADVLRRLYPVHRCDERGRFNLKGEYWRIGNSLLTPDELLQRADRYRKRAA